jgi:nucleoid-associated protein YgaU
MKRDARIGLAIVLVLGLSITFLVARALHERTQVAEAERYDEIAALDAVDREPDEAISDDAPPASRFETTDRFEEDAAERGLQEFLDDHQAPPPEEPARTETETVRSNASAAEVVEPPGRPSSTVAHNDTEHGSSSLPPLIGGPPVTETETEALPKIDQLPPSGWRYVVQSGDSPWRISAKVFGDGKYAAKIMKANSGLDARRLRIGQAIVIPALPGLAPRIALPASGRTAPSAAMTFRPMAASTVLGASRSPRVTAGAGTETHVVKAGDTLAAIARNYYGYSGPKSIKRILDANPGLEPHRLQIGQSLKVPAREQ